jgi:hypothetical protein
MLAIRDTHGRIVCYLDGDTGVPQDVNGKPVGHRVAEDKQTELTRLAVRWLSSSAVQMDLAPGDVMEPSTRADFGMPDAERDYIADQVSAVRFVKKDRGFYYTENVGDSIKLQITTSNPTGVQPEIQPAFTPTSFTTVGYSVAARLPRDVVTNADFPLKKRTLRFLVDVLRRAREVRVASQLTTSTNYASANRIAVTSGNWNGAVGAPLIDIFAALKASYLPADTLILPENADPYFYANANAQLTMYVQSGGPMPRALHARAKRIYNGSPAYIWMPTGIGNVALVRTIVHDDSWKHYSRKNENPPPDWEPNDDETDIATSMTLRWLGDEGVRDGSRIDGVLVREWEDDTVAGGHGGTHWISVAVNDIEIMPSNLVGAVITGALA